MEEDGLSVAMARLNPLQQGLERKNRVLLRQGSISALVEGSFFWRFFGIYLGGRFTTRVWLHECLVDVSEFLQNTCLLNGYGPWYCLLAFCCYNLLD
jgi:hypothetical protein